jgi:hypothetical protein
MTGAVEFVDVDADAIFDATAEVPRRPCDSRRALQW